MRGNLCRKQMCTVTVIHYCTDDCQLLIMHFFFSYALHCSSQIASYSSRITICVYPTCIRCPR